MYDNRSYIQTILQFPNFITSTVHSPQSPHWARYINNITILTTKHDSILSSNRITPATIPVTITIKNNPTKTVHWNCVTDTNEGQQKFQKLIFSSTKFYATITAIHIKTITDESIPVKKAPNWIAFGQIGCFKTEIQTHYKFYKAHDRSCDPIPQFNITINAKWKVN